MHVSHPGKMRPGRSTAHEKSTVHRTGPGWAGPFAGPSAIFFTAKKMYSTDFFFFFFFHENEAKCHGCRASGIFLGDAEILKKVSLFVCWVGLGGWRSAHVIGGTGMETKEIVCFACVLRFHLLFACSFIHSSFLLLHLLQPCRSQVLRSGPARAPAKPGNHVSIHASAPTNTHAQTQQQ